MHELTTDKFTEFFHALWNRDPFSWQNTLACRVMENTGGPWPEVIALPTASGKTACLDIAVFALAAQSGRSQLSQPVTAPRRIFFVVDRRVIVDEAFDRARALADKLRSATSGILLDVANGLRKLGAGEVPLACFQLRGGMYLSDSWAKNPAQPIIVASTVDQLGSRMLFRAYGRSFKAWPIQAGLVGNDVLILLDEAHCSVPFLETLRAVRKFRGWADRPLANPFHTVIMSATPPEGAIDVFRDTSDEPLMKVHPLGARQMAGKPAKLIETKARGGKAVEDLAKQLAKAAEELASDKPVAVVVFVNRVATARATFRFLREKHGERVILLTGRMRPLDKDDTVLKQLRPLSADMSEDRQLNAAVFVVATQTLEVGANLDFDVLVTECASLDALRQRFGRLNRMGRPIETRAAILIRADQAASSEDDPVYGGSLAATWKWLIENSDETQIIDMGISSLEGKLTGEAFPRDLNAPVNHAPVMLPSHVDCWAQTAPAPVPSPDVSVFLHGSGRSSSDVHVCWRADVDPVLENELLLEILTLCPPTVSECVSVPAWFFQRWLLGEAPGLVTLADMEGVPDTAKNGPDKQSDPVRRVIRWRGRDDVEIVSGNQKICPGDVMVIPTQLGGWDVLGDLPQNNGGPPVLDWGDRAYCSARGKALLRLHPAVIQEWPDFRGKSAMVETADRARELYEDDPDSLSSSLDTMLPDIAGDETAPGWLRLICRFLSEESGRERRVIPHPSGGGIVLQGTRRLPEAGEDTDCFCDEDDPTASGTVPKSLDSHLSGVSNLARRFASSCRLPDELIEVIASAGLLHDPGKADPRFQQLLRGGNPWGFGELLLAKSGDIPQGRMAYRQACRRSGYPEGGRHELLSVRLVENEPGLTTEDSGFRDLLLHLVASHHGHCRPFAPVVFDEHPVEVDLELQGYRLKHSSATGMEHLGSGVTERFWLLTRRYGWWGLAFLEAILRLADHRQSEWEEMQS